MSSVTRSLFFCPMSSRAFASSGTGPATPPARSPMTPLIAVSGVRSSWLTVETNCVFMRSTRLRSVVSA